MVSGCRARMDERPGGHSGGMLTHQALLLADHAVNAGYQAASVGGAFKTLGKVIFIILLIPLVIGLLIGLLIGFFVGRAAGRKQGSPASADLARD